MTAEQIEQKQQQLKQLAMEAQAICKELVEAGAMEMSEDELNQVAGGIQAGFVTEGGHGEWGMKVTTPEAPKSHYL